MPEPTFSAVLPVWPGSPLSDPDTLAARLDALWFQDIEDLEIVLAGTGSAQPSRIAGERLRAARQETASFASFFNQDTGVLERVSHPRYPGQGRTLTAVEADDAAGPAQVLALGLARAKSPVLAVVPASVHPFPGLFSACAALLRDGRADLAFCRCQRAQRGQPWPGPVLGLTRAPQMDAPGEDPAAIPGLLPFCPAFASSLLTRFGPPRPGDDPPLTAFLSRAIAAGARPALHPGTLCRIED